MYELYTSRARDAVLELLDVARLQANDIVVVGCSTSEVGGCMIGSASAPAVASALVAGILPVLRENGLFLAAQCCEHLNRALIVEEEVLKVYNLPRVNVLPQPKAGGSFATATWRAMQAPAAVESIQAAAGLDIGATLIGMHLRPVAVPVRLAVDTLGSASIVAARTRPKTIGGARAVYQQELL